jgi:hypothetical protein
LNVIPYIELNGTELANANRTLVYVNKLLDDRFAAPRIGNDASDPAHLACYCSVTSDVDYISPQADMADWWDGSNPASAEFLGMYAFSIVLSPVAKRSVTERNTGASIGALHASSRTIAVTGYLYATTPRGMVFGEDWLQSQLSGSTGCSDDILTILRACDSSEFADLHQIGLVDGPLYSQVGSIPDCNQEQVFFQLAAGWPYLVGSLRTITASTVITSGMANRVCGTITGAFGKTTAGKLTIVAGSADVTALEIFGEPCAGYVDAYPSLYDPYLSGSGTIVDLLVGTLPTGSTFVFDGITHTATLTDSGGRVIGGLDVLTPSPGTPFAWPEVKDGAAMCLCVVAGTVNAGTTVKVEAADRSL